MINLKPRMLLIDDNRMKSFVEELCMERPYLSKKSDFFKSDKLSTPDKLIQKLAAEKFNCLVLDIEMNFDKHYGINLCKQLRDLGVEMPIGFFSTHLQDDTVKKMLAHLPACDKILRQRPYEPKFDEFFSNYFNIKKYIK